MATPEDRRYCRDQYTIVQPNQGGTQQHREKNKSEYQQFVQWKRDNLTSQFSKSRRRTDMVTFNLVFQVRLFTIIALMATDTGIYLT